MRKTKEPNALEVLLYGGDLPSAQRTKTTPLQHPYERGMAITISTHRQRTDQLVQSFRDYYRTLLYGLTGENLSRDHIRVKSKLPPYRKVMDLVVAKTPLLVVGIHTFTQRDITTGKGSYGNYGFQHPHLYAYGVHHYLPPQERSTQIEHLTKLFCSHLKEPKKVRGVQKPVQIDPVGTGAYIYNDLITPTTLYKYLSIPSEDPNKHCWINYVAGLEEEDRNPLTYIYKEE